MAARRGCCCLRTLVSLIVILAILVGGIFCVYNFCSLSTFGVASIAGQDLGEIANIKFKDYKTFIDSLDVKEEDVVKNGYVVAEQEKEFDSIFDLPVEGETPTTPPATVGGENVTKENIINIVKPDTPVIYEQLDEKEFSDKQLAYLFDLMLKSDTVTEQLKAIGNANVPELSLVLENGKVYVRIVVKVDITKIKSQILAQIPPMVANFIKLGDSLYLTSVNEVKVLIEGDKVGTLAIVENALNGITVNNMDKALGDTILNTILKNFSSEGAEEITLASLNKTFGDSFCQVIYNLGRVGKVDKTGDMPVYVVDAAQLKAGSVILVTHTQSL